MAERIRHLLEYCKVPYTEKKYTPDTANQWFNEDKPKLMEKNPAMTLPYLIDGDKVITESDAICIYICHRSKRVDLLGRDANEWVQTATVWGVFKDFYRNYAQLVYGKYESEDKWKEALANSVNNFEPYLKKFNGLLGDQEFFAGKITWVDFPLADFLQVLSLLNEEYLKPFPKLSEFQKRIWNLPELKAYFSSDKYC